MSCFDDLAEARIREAQAAGAFSNLEGAGRPLDLERFEGVPHELRGAYAVLEGQVLERANGYCELVMRFRLHPLTRAAYLAVAAVATR